MKLGLVEFDPCEVTLFCNCPCIHNEFLKKLSRHKKMERLICTGKKTITEPFHLSDISSLPRYFCIIIQWIFLISCWCWCIWCICMKHPLVPSQLASWEKQNIVKRKIHRMHLTNVLKRLTMLVVKNYVTAVLWLITISWNNNCNFICCSCSWKIITSVISSLIKAKGNLALMFWRHM